jgi:hypothetical protein
MWNNEIKAWILIPEGIVPCSFNIIAKIFNEDIKRLSNIFCGGCGMCLGEEKTDNPTGII